MISLLLGETLSREWGQQQASSSLGCQPPEHRHLGDASLQNIGEQSRWQWVIGECLVCEWLILAELDSGPTCIAIQSD